jgi:hypothetical protein
MKVLTATAYEYPHLGRFTVSYKNEVLNGSLTRADLHPYALKHRFTHIRRTTAAGTVITEEV